MTLQLRLFDYFAGVKTAGFVLILIFLLAGCAVPKAQSEAKPISHAIWDQLLHKHVDQQGMVNYQGFQQDSVLFNQYLELLASAHPNDAHWSKEEQLAYWINAYNAFTVQLILDHYPVVSIKKIGGLVPFVNSSWDIRFINIEGHDYDLNNLEHGILRKHFEEPRIHFAINCASISCPPLRPEAYTAARIDQQLEEQARSFINDPQRNQLSKDEVRISKIFSWFKGDFTNNGSLINFLNRYATAPISTDASVRHLDYDWRLNDSAVAQ